MIGRDGPPLGKSTLLNSLPPGTNAIALHELYYLPMIPADVRLMSCQLLLS